jgi:GT2 family glycosyltransferase
MYRQLETRPELGFVGLCLRFADRSIQHMGIDFVPSGPQENMPFHPMAREKVPGSLLPALREVAAATGACLMMRAKDFWDAGGFDEEYAKECQDVALCLSLQRFGLKGAVLHRGEVLHLENATRPKGDASSADRERFLRLWSSFIQVRRHSWLAS